MKFLTPPPTPQQEDRKKSPRSAETSVLPRAANNRVSINNISLHMRIIYTYIYTHTHIHVHTTSSTSSIHPGAVLSLETSTGGGGGGGGVQGTVVKAPKNRTSTLYFRSLCS